jgi:hypothetical protein
MVLKKKIYVILGSNVGYNRNYPDNEYYEDNGDVSEYAEYSTGRLSGDLAYIIDELSGKYFIVGEILCINDGDSFSFDMSTIDNEKLKYKKLKVFDFILEKFGVALEPNIIVLTHWYKSSNVVK